MDLNEQSCVLIIDDDPLMLGALSSILSPHYLIKAARSGETGLLLTEKYDIDLILLDLVMKGMSGYEVLEKLKANEKTKHIPVIFITGSDSQTDEKKALENGAVDFIRKPFEASIVTLRVGIHLKLLNQMRTIERFSLTDGLTSVNNRRCFDKQIELEWNRAARNSSWISLLMLDIDNFKQFNDTYGHMNGDIALKTVANTLKETVQRGTDYVFRWGGEEFAAILPETPIEGAKIVAEKIRTCINETPIVICNKQVDVTISVGASSIIPKPGSYPFTIEKFCDVVDRSLYKAKQLGRNRVQAITYDDFMTKESIM